MPIKKLTIKYIRNAEKALEGIKVSDGGSITIKREKMLYLLDSSKRYLEDAKYSYRKSEFEVALASVAYCEGLLDALKMLGAASFKWSNKE